MADLTNLNSLSQIIKDEISKTNNNVNAQNVGQVVSVGDCIATIYGLDEAMYGEMIEFPHNNFGMVMNINEDSIDCALFNSKLLLKKEIYVKELEKL